MRPQPPDVGKTFDGERGELSFMYFRGISGLQCETTQRKTPSLYIYSEFIVWRSFRSSSQLQRALNTLAGSCLFKVKDIAKYLSNRWQKGNFEPFASSMKPAVYIYIYKFEYRSY